MLVEKRDLEIRHSHSTMYLLKHISADGAYKESFDSHSTMYLLKRYQKHQKQMS